MRGVRGHARRVAARRRLLRVRGAQTEYGRRLLVGRQKDVRFPHNHVVDRQVQEDFPRSINAQTLLSASASIVARQ